jgi:nucleotide-binding universal stress UspA family protein
MASHGRTGAVSAILGSQTQRVLAHCSVPVLVYRG